MHLFRSLTATAAFALSLAAPAAAQDSTQGHHMAAMELPEACQTAAAPPDMGDMAGMQSAMETMGEHQKAFMQGMMQTHDPMMQGMMAEDPDVAFACSMIPHHQGAISMAEVELQHGDDDQMKQMAQMIIDAQKKEIAELTQWIEEQAQ